MQHVAAIEKFDSKMWDKLIALNLTAGFQLTKAVLPAMVVNGYGRVINIASGTSPTGRMHNHTLLLMGAASTLPACYLLQCIGVSSDWFRVLSSACAPTTFLSFSGCSARLGWLHAQVGVRGEQARHRRLHQSGTGLRHRDCIRALRSLERALRCCAAGTGDGGYGSDRQLHLPG